MCDISAITNFKKIVRDVKILITRISSLLNNSTFERSFHRSTRDLVVTNLCSILPCRFARYFQDFHKKKHSTEEGSCVSLLILTLRSFLRLFDPFANIAQRSKHIFQSFLSLLVPSKRLLFTLSTLSRVIPNFNVAHFARRFFPFGTISVTRAQKLAFTKISIELFVNRVSPTMDTSPIDVRTR